MALQKRRGRSATASARQRALTLLLAPGGDVDVYLGALMTLQKLACSTAYFCVLDEVLALAGTALLRVVRDGLQSQHTFVPLAALMLLAQLATRDEGRAALVTTGVTGMLAPLCAGADVPGGAPAHMLATYVLVSLAHVGVRPTVRGGVLFLGMAAPTCRACTPS